VSHLANTASATPLGDAAREYLMALGRVLRANPRAHAVLSAPPGAPQMDLRAAREYLIALGVPPAQVELELE
jgi:hypothetical protein